MQNMMSGICDMCTYVLIRKADKIKILEFRTICDFDDVEVDGRGFRTICDFDDIELDGRGFRTICDFDDIEVDGRKH
jgi:hypothetical protein